MINKRNFENQTLKLPKNIANKCLMKKKVCKNSGNFD